MTMLETGSVSGLVLTCLKFQDEESFILTVASAGPVISSKAGSLGLEDGSSALWQLPATKLRLEPFVFLGFRSSH